MKKEIMGVCQNIIEITLMIGVIYFGWHQNLFYTVLTINWILSIFAILSLFLVLIGLKILDDKKLIEIKNILNKNKTIFYYIAKFLHYIILFLIGFKGHFIQMGILISLHIISHLIIKSIKDELNEKYNE